MMSGSKATGKRGAGDQAESPFINRELSWIGFNARVLGEALDRRNPPLERLKFLSIVSSNFDEFFMVRVASLKAAVARRDRRKGTAGMRAGEQLAAISRRVKPMIKRQYQCLTEEVLPALAEAGLRLLDAGEYTARQREFAAALFQDEIFPTLTPRLVAPGETLPVAGNRRLYLAFLLKPVSPEAEERKGFAIVGVPPVLDRCVKLPSDEPGVAFGLLEDVIRLKAAALFPGHDIDEHAVLRLTRDADMSVDEARDEDFLEAMAEVLVARDHSEPVRLEIRTGSRRLRSMIVRSLPLGAGDIYDLAGPPDLKPLMKLCFLDGFDALRNEEWQPVAVPAFADPGQNVFSVLQGRDVLLHHPYDSFEPVLRLFRESASDPAVLAIKVMLYRTSGNSPIIRSLERAARNGKQVTAVVELKARFDEEQNIGWARRLEKAGVIVVYGIATLKIHAKAALVVRREDSGVRTYCHFGTGNYNDSTARLYTDFGLLTSRPELTYEATLFFNAVTGYTAVPHLRQLMMAPTMLRNRFEQLVQREIDRSTPEEPGRIDIKINSLACPRMAELLYRASRAGVRVRLNIRGICCLRPGVPGLSENIEVVSIVDRFLEHSRIFWFRNGGEPELFLGSADWMGRNLDRRVELVFPILDPRAQRHLRRALDLFFGDTAKAHVMRPDGHYVKRRAGRGQKPVRCQQEFYRDAVAASRSAGDEVGREFQVRRRPPGE